MRKVNNIGLYGILTKPVVGYEELAKIMVDEGVSIIQLRMKDVPAEEIVSVGNRLRAIIPEKVAFIMNDDPHLAVEVGADGVHLGQDDMDYLEARKIVGDEAIIGISTHNPGQTTAACSIGPDYIGVGPVFATPTKVIPDPLLGLDGMREMLDVATVPAVCLGGIDHDNIASVVEAGARNICAVRCITASTNPAVEIRRLMKMIP